MSLKKTHKVWSDHVHESVIKSNASGQLNLSIKGGAEESSFPYFDFINQKKVKYDSGKIDNGEILLEVNNQLVVGLTLYDLNSLIVKEKSLAPVHFRTIKQDHGLPTDLKFYLSERFTKGSVDHQLQKAIRDNLYLRSLPCTTRKAKPDEVDGVDYTFLTIDEFKELEKSGALLESGIFDGNYYGTPKPHVSPLTPAPLRRFDSANHLSGFKPAAKIKRNRNRFNIGRSSLTTSSQSSIEKQKYASTPHLIGEVPNSDSSQSHKLDRYKQLSRSDSKLGPLPQRWEVAQTEKGEYYYIDHVEKKTTWIDPRLEMHQNKKKLEDYDDDELPVGWERVDDPQYGVYYVNHYKRVTQYENPVLQAKKEAAAKTKKIKKTEDQTTHDKDRISNEGSGFTFTRDPSKLKGSRHLVPVKKGSKGFGFTIIGGDNPEEFLQIKGVVPGGAASCSGNVKQGDIIVKIEDNFVLGWSHTDVVQLFQAIPIGHVVTLDLCRGCPLYSDANDSETVSSTKVDQANNNHSDIKLKLANGGVPLGEPFPGTVHSSNSSKSASEMPILNSYDPMYVGNPFSPIPVAPAYNIYSRPNHFNTLPTPMVVQVIANKGEKDFGFTIADSPYGQYVNQVFQQLGLRWNEIMVGDILLEVNGVNVLNMPHNDVIKTLNDCLPNSPTIFVLSRHPMAMYKQTYDPVWRSQNNLNNYVINNHAPDLNPMLKRSHTDPSIRNGSQGTSPAERPGSASSGENHPMSALLKEHRSKHAPSAENKQQTLPDAHINHPMAALLSEYKKKHKVRSGKADASSLSSDRTPSKDDSNPSDFVDLDVALKRRKSGFGFRVLGGTSTNKPISVGAIVPGGAADTEGSLQTGDLILSIDSKKVPDLTHHQVVKLLGDIAVDEIVRFRIRRKVTEPYDAKPFDLTLHRSEHEGFGLTIVSSVTKRGLLSETAHKIGKITEGSPADRCGQIEVDDHVLAINKVDVSDLFHPQIIRLIKDSGLSIALRILPFDGTAKDERTSKRSLLKMVKLHRSHNGFGFGIRGGCEYSMPLYVLRVAETGSAAESGQIQVGDVLVKINGRSTSGMSHAQAVQLIKEGGSIIRLTLQSGDGTVPDVDSSQETNSMTPESNLHQKPIKKSSKNSDNNNRSSKVKSRQKIDSTSTSKDSTSNKTQTPDKSASNTLKWGRVVSPNSSGDLKVGLTFSCDAKILKKNNSNSEVSLKKTIKNSTNLKRDKISSKTPNSSDPKAPSKTANQKLDTLSNETRKKSGEKSISKTANYKQDKIFPDQSQDVVKSKLPERNTHATKQKQKQTAIRVGLWLSPS